MKWHPIRGNSEAVYYYIQPAQKRILLYSDPGGSNGIGVISMV